MKIFTSINIITSFCMPLQMKKKQNDISQHLFQGKFYVFTIKLQKVFWESDFSI